MALGHGKPLAPWAFFEPKPLNPAPVAFIAAPVIVVGASQKRKRLLYLQGANSTQLRKAYGGVVVAPVARRPKLLTAVHQTKPRRPPVQPQLFGTFGTPTTKTVPDGPKVLLQSIQRGIQRLKVRVRVKLGKPTKSTVVVVSRRPRLQVILAKRRIQRLFTARFTHVFGRPTARPKVRGPRVLSFCAKASELRRITIANTTVLFKAGGGVVVPPVTPDTYAVRRSPHRRAVR